MILSTYKRLISYTYGYILLVLLHILSAETIFSDQMKISLIKTKLYYFLYRDREKWIPIEHGVGPVLAINGLDDQYVLLFIQIIFY